MDWIRNFDLFLFDFDGLLVNTEEMHYRAYQRMMNHRGVTLEWDFNRYCKAAHYEATALRDHILQEYPDLFKGDVTWDVLYQEKQNALLELIQEGKATLMPGVANLLMALSDQNIPRAVVTHSPNKLITLIRSQNPLLDSIPTWITREQYQKPKPDPECYQLAIQKLKKEGDKVIGFEDTPRGLRALRGTEATAVLICTTNYPEIPDFLKAGALQFDSFESISKLP